MYLLTDEQTIDDLRIFSKRDIPGIYDIYNHTHTRGGETVLEQMFRYPLSDITSISNRSSVIAGFARLDLSFPFGADLFDMTEKYLASSEEEHATKSRASLSDKELQNGVAATIGLLHQVNRLVQDPGMDSVEAWAGDRSKISNLLHDPAFEPVLREKPDQKLSYAATTAYDQLFRTRERAKLRQLLQHLYYFDVYVSVARVAKQRNFIFPQPLEKGSMELLIGGVYHPELKQPVANSIVMDPGRNVIFLTGANMAGKSTFLRSISTALYIAHMGFPVAAAEMKFSVMDGIFTTINLPDNLGIGASHFYAEVLRVKKVAAELGAGRRLFIIFDEMFRGTNVKDAHEATVVITRAFARKPNSKFIISSHIVEAGDELAQEPGIGFKYLPTRMNGHNPEYTYTLEEGITADRHGMIIIRNEGILNILENGRKRAAS